MTLTHAIQRRDALRSNGVRCQLKYVKGQWRVCIAGVDY